uniref:Uncharacterized protein n=1 Tax=Amphimedon queenslandica TaxID=400682 RepID=A0A1X7SSY2_AMPQE
MHDDGSNVPVEVNPAYDRPNVQSNLNPTYFEVNWSNDANPAYGEVIQIHGNRSHVQTEVNPGY